MENIKDLQIVSLLKKNEKDINKVVNNIQKKLSLKLEKKEDINNLKFLINALIDESIKDINHKKEIKCKTSVLEENIGYYNDMK